MKHNTPKQTVIEEEEEEPIKGRITLGLFGKIAPKATENFRSLCACDKGNGKISGKPLCYEGSTFHRISELVLIGYFPIYFISCPRRVSQHIFHAIICLSLCILCSYLKVPNFGIQGGDITENNGVGGESIYGGYFDDESFEVCVCMTWRTFLQQQCNYYNISYIVRPRILSRFNTTKCIY